MVTDGFGLPVEFRYTEPVVATKLQRILYGDVLDRYIQTDVILAHLLENLENKPALFVLSNADFLGAVDGTGRVALWLGETHNPPLAQIGAQQDVGPDEILMQLSQTGAPARIRFADGVDPDRRAEAIKLIGDVADTMDVAEPMRRVEKAVKLLWEESTATDAQALAEK